MEHSFNIEVAKEIGVNGAILLKYLYFWILKNEANNKHFADGYYWTYNSVKAFNDLFPYLSEKQIRSALQKLEEDGYIITGNYNKSSYDRTKWYAITEKGKTILLKGQMEIAKGENEFTQKGEPIPVNKTISKPVKKSKTIVLESGAPVKSYGDIFKAPEYSQIADALRKFITQCKGMNYTPQIATVKKWADLLVAEGKNSPEYAMRIVNQSIDKGWKALYPLKGYSGEAVSIPSSEDRLAKDAQGNHIVF